jgi:hypothetical protein
MWDHLTEGFNCGAGMVSPSGAACPIGTYTFAFNL